VEHRIAGLGDMPRSGGPWSVTDEQVAALVTKTLESRPKNATHWSTRSMAAEMGISTWNTDPRPYVWTKTADEILERLATYLNRTPDSGH
jgi:hypothetical protein